METLLFAILSEYNYRILRVTPEDAGEIQCEVRTSIDRVVSQPAVLEVLRRTAIVEQSPGMVEVVEGSPLQLECRQGIQISNKNHFLILTLSLEPPLTQDSLTLW